MKIRFTMPFFTIFMALWGCISTANVTTGDKPCMKSREDVLMGFTRADLNDSTCFDWFKPGYTGYRPDAAAISTIAQYRKNITAVAFAGSWCEDTRVWLPI